MLRREDYIEPEDKYEQVDINYSFVEVWIYLDTSIPEVMVVIEDSKGEYVIYNPNRGYRTERGYEHYEEVANYLENEGYVLVEGRVWCE